MKTYINIYSITISYVAKRILIYVNVAHKNFKMLMFYLTVKIKRKLLQVTPQKRVIFKSYTAVQRAYFNTPQKKTPVKS